MVRLAARGIEVGIVAVANEPCGIPVAGPAISDNAMVSLTLSVRGNNYY